MRDVAILSAVRTPIGRAVRGNLRRFPPMRSWRSLRDETDFPLVVWAFAHRPEGEN